MKQNKHAKAVSFWTSRMALLLLLLIVAVAYVFVGTFAKYTSSSEGSDSARVARFAVSAAFTGAENSKIIRCADVAGQTGETIKTNSTVTYSSIEIKNTQRVGEQLYIAETSQKVDLTVSTYEALHEVFGLQMCMSYTDGTGTHVVEYEGEPTMDENGRYVYTFFDVCTFPIKTDSEGKLIEQTFSCDLQFYITSDSVQPLTGVQLFVGAVGTQLD